MGEYPYLPKARKRAELRNRGAIDALRRFKARVPGLDIAKDASIKVMEALDQDIAKLEGEHG